MIGARLYVMLIAYAMLSIHAGGVLFWAVRPLSMWRPLSACRRITRGICPVTAVRGSLMIYAVITYDNMGQYAVRR
eukprot:17578-Eustigmatos_ZCMA.PRE.1